MIIPKTSFLPIISLAVALLNASVFFILRGALSDVEADNFFLAYAFSINLIGILIHLFGYNLANFLSRVHSDLESQGQLLGGLVTVVCLVSFGVSIIVVTFVGPNPNPNLGSTIQSIGFIWFFCLALLLVSLTHAAVTFLRDRYLLFHTVLLFIAFANLVIIFSLLESAEINKFGVRTDEILAIYAFTAFVGAICMQLIAKMIIVPCRPGTQVSQFLRSSFWVIPIIFIFSITGLLDPLIIGVLEDGQYADHALALRMVIAASSVVVMAYGPMYTNTLASEYKVSFLSRRKFHLALLAFSFGASVCFDVLHIYSLVFVDILSTLSLSGEVLRVNLLSLYPMLAFSFLVRDEIHIGRWRKMVVCSAFLAIFYVVFVINFAYYHAHLSISYAHSAAWWAAVAIYFLHRKGSRT